MKKLENYKGGYPAEFYFHDIEDDKLKKTKVTKQAVDKTLKTFKQNNNDTDPQVIIKYLSQQNPETTKTIN